MTRIDGRTQEWDIAHHLKMGRQDIAPSLNPKPGFRVALFHSMGLAFPSLGLNDLKALIEPMAVVGGSAQYFKNPRISLQHPEIGRGSA